MVPIPRRLIELCLQKLIPLTVEAGELFAQNAEDNGLPPRLNWWISTYGVSNWAQMYLSAESLWEAHIDGVEPRGLEQIWAIDWSLANLTSLDSIYAAIWQAVENALLTDALEPDLPESPEAEEELLANMPASEREKYLAARRKVLNAALVVVHNYFACMAYKKSMFQLVAEATKGNRKSFLKAIHVDPTCLESLDDFRSAVLKAATSKHDKLIPQIQAWRQKPPLASGVKLNGFYLTVFFLNLLGVLDQFKSDMNRFADLCQSLGIYGPDPEEDAVDVASFSKALLRFESEHQAIHLVPPGKLIVKDTL